MRGTWNVLPVVLLSLGAAVFGAGWAPRWAGLIGSLPATGGLLVLVVAESVAAPLWVRELSPFAHLAAVPLARGDAAAAAVMLAAAVLLAVVGIAEYCRRDLQA